MPIRWEIGMRSARPTIIPWRQIAGAVVLIGSAAAPPAATTAALFVAPLHEAPSYESDHAAESRLRGLGSAPEADARPGEYYFLLGAQAYRKHDYEHAIEMYQVAASWAYKPAEYNLGVIY